MPIPEIQSLSRRTRNAQRRITRNKGFKRSSEKFQDFVTDMMEERRDAELRKEQEAQRKQEVEEARQHERDMLEARTKAAQETAAFGDKLSRAGDRMDDAAQATLDTDAQKRLEEKYGPVVEQAKAQLRQGDTNAAYDLLGLPKDAFEHFRVDEFLNFAQGQAKLNQQEKSAANMKAQMEAIQQQQLQLAISKAQQAYSTGGSDALANLIWNDPEMSQFAGNTEFRRAIDTFSDAKPQMPVPEAYEVQLAKADLQTIFGEGGGVLGFFGLSDNEEEVAGQIPAEITPDSSRVIVTAAALARANKAQGVKLSIDDLPVIFDVAREVVGVKRGAVPSPTLPQEQPPDAVTQLLEPSRTDSSASSPIPAKVDEGMFVKTWAGAVAQSMKANGTPKEDFDLDQARLQLMSNPQLGGDEELIDEILDELLFNIDAYWGE